MKPLGVVLLLAIPASIWAQGLKLDHLDRLASKANETVNITLDSSLLKLASAFLSSGDADTADIKKLIAGIQGIWIRSFEFKNTGEYLDADVDAIRAQLRDPDWKRIIEVRSKTEGDADVYLHTAGGRILGLTLISAEPKELTVVNINGAIDAEGLSKLGGNFGIPRFNTKKPGKNEEKGK